MKKRVSELKWIPFWGDKWLFGSMRIEFDVAERGVWWDLMALAMKDDGYIRANEDIPYPPQQLAGMLLIKEEFLVKTIEKFIKAGKLTRLANGTLWVTNWDKYRFTDRHIRTFKKNSSAKTEQPSSKTEAILDKKRIDKNRKDNNKNILYETEFDTLWKQWPAEARAKKANCLMKFKALCKQGKQAEFKKATQGYAKFLDYQKNVNNFDQKCMHLSTWLNNWEGDKEKYIDFKYEPPL